MTTYTYPVTSDENHTYTIINQEGIIATGTVTNLTENEIRNINVDLTSYKTITISTSVTGLNTRFKVGGRFINGVETALGNYSVKLASSTAIGTEIFYYIVDDNYAPYYSSVIYEGDNIIENVNLVSCTKSTLTRPNLTENGILGGDSFAVSAKSASSASPAWKAMDDSTSTSWVSENLNKNNTSPTEYADYIIYNPNFFLVGSFTLTTTSSSYCPYNLNVYTSADGINWELDQTILANTSASLTVTMNSTLPYKYIRLNMNMRLYYYYYIQLTNITFTNMYEWVVSNTYNLTINTTPSDAVVLFNSQNASGKTVQVPYAGGIQYTVAKAGYKPVSGVASTINTDKTVNVSLTEQTTPDTTWHAWTNNGTTVYTQTETPEATLDWTFSAPNTIANIISAVSTDTITSNSVTYTKAPASNIEGYLTTQTFTIQTDAYTANNTDFYLPVEINTPYALAIDWGDGNTELVQGVGIYPHHTYTTKGTYQISIKSELCKMPRLLGALYSNGTYKNPNYQLKSMDSLSLPMYQNYLEDFNDFNTDTDYYITWQAKNMIKSCSNLTEKANLEVYKCLFDGNTVLTTAKGAELFNTTTIDKLSEYNSTFQNCSTLSGVLALPNLITINGGYGMEATFYGCTSLTSVSFPSLTTVSGSYGMENTFRGCNSIASLDLSNLTTVSGYYAMYFAYAFCTNLTSINLSSLTTVSNTRGICYTFRNCTNLTSVTLPQLTIVSGSEGLASCFYGCTKLSSATLPSLAAVTSSSGLSALFEGCTSLETMSFPSLQQITGAQCLRYCFNGCTSLTSVLFPSLTSISFGSYTNQFINMLSGCSGVTVHFPSNLQSVIGNWSDITNGFGGTNITVLFDLPATT